MKLNDKENRGFSLVELLAVIVLLGIIATAATIAVSRYLNKAQKQSYETMESSVYDAAQNYMMDYVGNLEEDMTISISDLVKMEYLDSLIDPAKKDGTQCSGDVVVKNVAASLNDGVYTLGQLQYTIKLKCSRYASGGTNSSGDPKGVIYPK